jgi:hypothetical protein
MRRPFAKKHDQVSVKVLAAVTVPFSKRRIRDCVTWLERTAIAAADSESGNVTPGRRGFDVSIMPFTITDAFLKFSSTSDFGGTSVALARKTVIPKIANNFENMQRIIRLCRAML